MRCTIGMRAMLAGLLAAILGAVAPPAAVAQDERTIVKTGRFAAGELEWRYVPIEVPAGVRELTVRYEYDGRPANALDIALFDADGYDLGNDAGFRGSSGGGASELTVSAGAASDGYLPGPIEPGTWHVALGPYRVAPAGLNWRVEATLRFGDAGPAYQPRPAPQRVNDRPGWYRGDTHVHTDHSGGVEFPTADLAAEARSRGLDWFASTDYYTPRAHLEWGGVDTSGLLVLNGEEAVTRDGHWNPIGLTPGNWVDYRYGPEDGVLQRMVAEVHADGGLAIANHPFTGCGGCHWQFPYGPMDAIELWNGAWGTDEERALELWRGLLEGGQGRPIVGASDGRGSASNPLGSPAQTVVRAGALARPEILDGIRRGRSYVAASSAVTLRMTARAGRERAGLGQRLDVNGRRPAEVRLRVRGVPGGEVTFHSEAGEIARARVTGENEDLRAIVRARRAELVRAEVRRPDGTMAALTNPIWIGREPRERPLAMVGTPDGSSLELALAPNGYGRYATAFPAGVNVDAGSADPARDWPYIQPGPLDAWGGSGDRTFRLRFDLGRAPRGEIRFVAWLLDTPRWAPGSTNRPVGPSSLAVSLNGRPIETVALQPGGNDGYHWGDGNLYFAGIRPRAVEVALPRSALRRGANEIAIARPDGSWVVYDAVGVVASSR